MSDAQRQRLAERQSKAPDLVVISAIRDWSCSLCTATDEKWLIMEDPGPVCLTCAGLDHLVFLPSGDAALTRRARKASQLAAVVVHSAGPASATSGILVEEAALDQAEQECLADEEARQRSRARAEAARRREDVAFQDQFAGEIRRLFPGCPPQRAATSPGGPAPGAAVGSGAAPPAGASIRMRSAWRWLPRCDTWTPPTTAC